jgi:hypothetical protein
MEEEKTYTDTQIRAAHEKAEALTSELDWNMSDDSALDDYLNVLYNAFWSVLASPERDWDLDGVLNANWDGEADTDEYASAAAWVRGWH